MSKLSLIIKNEYLSDVRSKSFWIATIVFPILIGVFGIVIGFLAEDSEALKTTMSPTAPDQSNMTGYQVLGMLMGMFLTLFLMVYGAQIFNKVKQEKCNRIVEVIATCVEGRTMMLAKIIAVALTGLTQLMLWGLFSGIIVYGIWIVFNPSLSLGFLLTGKFWGAVSVSLLYFIGGYVLYGSLFAAVGAMTDKNNENQEYMTVLTFLLLAAFYIGQYAADNSGSALTVWCEYIPFTSPTVGAINATAGSFPVWATLISLAVLYATAFIALSISGKIYTSSLLLMGKKITMKDLVTFIKSK